MKKPMNKTHPLVQQLGEGRQMNRRMFMRGFAALGMLTGLASCGAEQPNSPGLEASTSAPAPQLRAAYSHNGLNTIWNQRGRDTAKYLGGLLGIDVVSYDGELNVDKQRRDLATIAEQDWDFVVVHPLAVNAYTEQIRQITSHGIPVIDIDTRLADNLDDLRIVTFLESDNIRLAEQVTSLLIEAVQRDSFEIVHTQGLLTHTGAQQRAQGFRNVIARYPNITIVDETPADWKIDKVTDIWEQLLQRHPDVRAGFFHNDEMALAAMRSINKAQKTSQVMVAGIDGMQAACEAVAANTMVATALNPTGRIHGGALWVGYFLATQGERANVPPYIRIDGGIVDKETAEGFIWQGDHLLI